MEKLLFICLGNICRSPAAQGVMQHLIDEAGLSGQFEIDSAGIGSWHVGQLPDKRMRDCAHEHGYELTHRARVFKRQDFDVFDWIFVMDEENYYDVCRHARNENDRKKVVRLAQFLRHHPGQDTLPDPYYGGRKDFDFVIDLLEDCCQAVLEWLRK